MGERVIPQYVQAFAAKHKVPLAQVRAEHQDAGMTLIDVSTWAQRKGDGDLAAEALTAQFKWNCGEGSPAVSNLSGGRRHPSGTVSAYDVKQVPVNAMARNPLVDQVRAAASAKHMPGPSGTPPSLFVTGDAPAFCASGIPPQAVLGVPFQARHAMAAAPTAAEAYAIQVECSGKDAAQKAEMFYGSHPGNEDYAARVEQWRIESMSNDQLELDGTTAARDELNRREAALPPLGPSSKDQAIIDAVAANYGLGPR